MIYRRITPPEVEPITLQEAKDYLREQEGPMPQASVIEGMIAAARGMAESAMRQRIITQTWRLDLDSFPVRTSINPTAAIEIPLPPLASVSEVAYTDSNGDPQTVDPSVYLVETSDLTLVDPAPGRVSLKHGESWPSIRSDDPASVQITFVCGHGGLESVPAEIRSAILLLMADLYEHREGQIVGTIVGENETVRRLLRLNRSGNRVVYA